MPASQGPSDRTGQPESRDVPSDDPAASPPAEVLLETVLRQTLLASAPDGAVTDADMSLLLAVVDRYKGQAFRLDPIAVELVQAVIRGEYRPLTASDAAWQAMTRQIAHTLCEDPTSHQRFQALWAHLCELER